MGLVFFGSGPVSAKSLELLAKSFDIEAVITKTHTDNNVHVAPVEEVANRLAVETHKVKDKHELQALIKTIRFSSRVAVLVDFGIIVSQKSIDCFDLGIVNSHFSLLPEWRGADPITYALLSGQKKTGVSLMLLSPKMDEGKIIGFAEQEIEETDDATSLTDKLIKLSDSLLKELLPEYIKNKKSMPQNQASLLAHNHAVSYSRKINKSDGLIDFSKPASVLDREVRAFSVWPKSFTYINNERVIVTKCRVSAEKLNPGQLKLIDSKLLIGTSKNSLEILQIQPAGKKPMTAQSFLAGRGNLIK